MKRTLYILSASLLFLATSCVREQIDSIEPVLSSKDRVPIVMSFASEGMVQTFTKADDGMEMSVNPAIKTIHVAVFGSSGYLKDYSSAIPCDSEGNPTSGFVDANDATGYFKVYLPFDEGPSTRRIHIIANGPSSLPFNASEDEIIKNLTVKDGNGAYWTRIIAAEGIQIKRSDVGSGSVPIPDPVTGEYQPTDATKSLFTNLQLIRNFASITVKKNAGAPDNFEILGFTVCNMPSEGAIAIYNENASDWIPGDGYAGLTLDASAHLTYATKVYPGFPTSPRINTYIPKTAAAFDAAGISVPESAPVFIYERAVTGENAPFVIIKARYNSSGSINDSGTETYFYRLDITPDNNYVPFYRNFSYTVKISGIQVPGYATPGEAAKRNSGDNFSVSLETQTLPGVSNGTTQLIVEYPEMAHIYSSGTKSFWFEHLLIGEGYYNATQSISGGDITVTVEETQKGAIKNLSVADSDDIVGTEKRRSISYELNSTDPENPVDLTSVIRITGAYTPSGGAEIKLVRDVTITVLSPRSFTAAFSPNTVSPNPGEKTNLNINLPEDLPHSAFPLVFKIEDTALGLNADEDEVPVSPGNSIIPAKAGTPSYQFLKTLNWSEYKDLIKDATLSGLPNPVLSVGMKTTKSRTSTTAYISNDYFVQATAALDIDENNYISPGTTTVNYQSHDDIHINVTSAGTWGISITRENGTAVVGTSLSPSYGSTTDSEDVTVTIPANPGAHDRTFILTLQNVDHDITRQATIIQTGRAFKLTTSTPSVKGDGTTTASLSLNSEFEGDWSLTVPDGCTASPHSGSGIGTTPITLTMPANYSLDDDIIRTIIANGPESTVSSVKVTQRKAKAKTGQTVTFNTTSGAPAGSRYTTANKIVSINGITGEFNTIDGVSGTYMTLNRSSNRTLTLTIDDTKIIEITRIVFSFTNTSYCPVSTYSSCTTGSVTWGSPTTWTGAWSGSPSFQIIFDRNNYSIRMTQYEVTYSGYTWD